MKRGLITATAVIKTLQSPLPNSCPKKWIIYQANIGCDIAGYKQKCSFGSCETKFNNRFGNQIKHKNHTERSKELWEIKNRNGKPKIKWNIRTCHSYNPNKNCCLLCLNEKYEIATYLQRRLPFKQQNWNNKYLQTQKHKLPNGEAIDWRQIHAIRYH